jgi:pimeloyl-ACP methyl ester carboxylesterase
MRCRVAARPFLLMAFLFVNASLTQRTVADDGEHFLTVDHYVSVHSTVPFMSGQISQIYVRERLQAGMVLRAASVADRVVLFVHGAGTPAEVAFDVPYQDYSWMAYLAQSGFDVFAMDVTGYGRSTRPTAMNDPCNLTRKQRSIRICYPRRVRQATRGK